MDCHPCPWLVLTAFSTYFLLKVLPDFTLPLPV